MVSKITVSGTRDGNTGFPPEKKVPVDTALVKFVSELGFGAYALENSATRIVLSVRVFSHIDETHFCGSLEDMQVLHEALVYWNDITQPTEHTQRFDIDTESNIPTQWTIHTNKVHFITFLAAGLRSDDISYLLNQWKMVPLEDLLATVRLSQETEVPLRTVMEDMFGRLKERT